MKPTNKDLPNLGNPDGTKLDDECEKVRVWLGKYYGDPYTMALRLFLDEPRGFSTADEFDPHIDQKYLSHAKSCQACRAWIAEYCGEKVFFRQERLSQYCCPLLYGAIEKPRKGSLRIQLRYYSPERWEGAYNWELKLVDYPGVWDSLLINYCPFCGKSIKIAN